MATHHGKEGSVYVGANEVGEVTDWSYTENASLAEDTEITNSGKTYKAGIPDGGGRITCHWDPDDTDGQNTLRAGDSVTLHLYPTGNDAGDVEFTGSAIIESMEITGSRDGMVQAVFTYKGVLTEQTIT